MVAGLLIFVFLSFLCFCDNSVVLTFCLHARQRDETRCQLTLCSLSALKTDDVRSSSFVCRIPPTAFVIVLSWVERRWVFSVIGRVFQPRHAEKKNEPCSPSRRSNCSGCGCSGCSYGYWVLTMTVTVNKNPGAPAKKTKNCFLEYAMVCIECFK